MTEAASSIAGSIRARRRRAPRSAEPPRWRRGAPGPDWTRPATLATIAAARRGGRRRRAEGADAAPGGAAVGSSSLPLLSSRKSSIRRFSLPAWRRPSQGGGERGPARAPRPRPPRPSASDLIQTMRANASWRASFPATLRAGAHAEEAPLARDLDGRRARSTADPRSGAQRQKRARSPARDRARSAERDASWPALRLRP